MKLLIIEDEQDIITPLKKGLQRRGFAVDAAEDGKTGLELAQLNNYDCILLDLNLPGIDGLTLAQSLRKTHTTPIIMLTARSQQYDKLVGFETGADDYLTKPFDFLELVARINVIIKRNSNNKQHTLKIGSYTFDPQQSLIYDTSLNDPTAKITLSNKESRILEYLIRHEGQYVSAEELLEHIWDSEVNTFSHTIKTHIKTLRQKIDPEKKLIRTVRGKGYTT